MPEKKIFWKRTVIGNDWTRAGELANAITIDPR
jgi:hypothetical protein